MQIVGSKETSSREGFQPTSDSKEGNSHWTRFQQLPTTSVEYPNATNYPPKIFNLNFWKLVNIFYKLCEHVSNNFLQLHQNIPMLELSSKNL
jgi:hypothetical protein